MSQFSGGFSIHKLEPFYQVTNIDQFQYGNPRGGGACRLELGELKFSHLCTVLNKDWLSVVEAKIIFIGPPCIPLVPKVGDIMDIVPTPPVAPPMARV